MPRGGEQDLMTIFAQLSQTGLAPASGADRRAVLLAP
jgi:hypothetical protein